MDSVAAMQVFVRVVETGGLSAAGRALANPWFARHVVVGNWFLHRDVPPLA